MSWASLMTSAASGQLRMFVALQPFAETDEALNAVAGVSLAIELSGGSAWFWKSEDRRARDPRGGSPPSSGRSRFKVRMQKRIGDLDNLAVGIDEKEFGVAHG